MNLTEAARGLHKNERALAKHLEESAREEKRLRSEIGLCQSILMKNASGIDHEKVDLAKTVVFASDYGKGGKNRDSCIADAIRQLATGEPIRPTYGDLFVVFFGTKNYQGWIDQRSDCKYGYGPGHGSTVFRVGLTDEARERGYGDFTPEEIEAAIYYLNNLARVQEIEELACKEAGA